MPEDNKQRRRSSFIPTAEQVKAQESQNLIITYGILIVLLLILWVLYTGLHGRIRQYNVQAKNPPRIYLTFEYTHLQTHWNLHELTRMLEMYAFRDLGTCGMTSQRLLNLQPIIWHVAEPQTHKGVH
ncbi:unnamed protein product [Notodromas monacha]|uniref:Uncharacterized protein n=1 Tax=Notodromas monacha TaxID=399045 RepID=A0A7R9GGJ2_9CRUS|nr:unnamed protein product [Notodromas monacha]CAG0921902.1 unnamed protein product [Notodromas monacha]